MTLARHTVSFVIFSQQGGTEYITLSPLKRINYISSAPVPQVFWFHSFLSCCQYLEGSFFASLKSNDANPEWYLHSETTPAEAARVWTPNSEVRNQDLTRPDQSGGARGIRVKWKWKWKPAFWLKSLGIDVLFLLKCHFCGICCDQDAACEKTQTCWNRYSADDESYFTFHSVLLSELYIKGGKKSFCCGCLPGQGWISLGKKCPPPSGKKWKSFKNSRTLKLADSAALEVSQRRFHSSHLHFHLQYLFKISLHV